MVTALMGQPAAGWGLGGCCVSGSMERSVVCPPDGEGEMENSSSVASGLAKSLCWAGDLPLDSSHSPSLGSGIL